MSFSLFTELGIQNSKSKDLFKQFITSQPPLEAADEFYNSTVGYVLLDILENIDDIINDIELTQKSNNEILMEDDEELDNMLEVLNKIKEKIIEIVKAKPEAEFERPAEVPVPVRVPREPRVISAAAGLSADEELNPELGCVFEKEIRRTKRGVLPKQPIQTELFTIDRMKKHRTWITGEIERTLAQIETNKTESRASGTSAKDKKILESQNIALQKKIEKLQKQLKIQNRLIEQENADITPLREKLKQLYSLYRRSNQKLLDILVPNMSTLPKQIKPLDDFINRFNAMAQNTFGRERKPRLPTESKYEQIEIREGLVLPKRLVTDYGQNRMFSLFNTVDVDSDGVKSYRFEQFISPLRSHFTINRPVSENYKIIIQTIPIDGYSQICEFNTITGEVNFQLIIERETRHTYESSYKLHAKGSDYVLKLNPYVEGREDLLVRNVGEGRDSRSKQFVSEYNAHLLDRLEKYDERIRFTTNTKLNRPKVSGTFGLKGPYLVSYILNAKTYREGTLVANLLGLNEGNIESFANDIHAFKSIVMEYISVYHDIIRFYNNEKELIQLKHIADRREEIFRGARVNMEFIKGITENMVIIYYINHIVNQYNSIERVASGEIKRQPTVNCIFPLDLTVGFEFKGQILSDLKNILGINSPSDISADVTMFLPVDSIVMPTEEPSAGRSAGRREIRAVTRGAEIVRQTISEVPKIIKKAVLQHLTRNSAQINPEIQSIITSITGEISPIMESTELTIFRSPVAHACSDASCNHISCQQSGEQAQSIRTFMLDTMNLHPMSSWINELRETDSRMVNIKPIFKHEEHPGKFPKSVTVNLGKENVRDMVTCYQLGSRSITPETTLTLGGHGPNRRIRIIIDEPLYRGTEGMMEKVSQNISSEYGMRDQPTRSNPKINMSSRLFNVFKSDITSIISADPESETYECELINIDTFRQHLINRLVYSRQENFSRICNNFIKSLSTEPTGIDQINRHITELLGSVYPQTIVDLLASSDVPELQISEPNKNLLEKLIRLIGSVSSKNDKTKLIILGQKIVMNLIPIINDRIEKSYEGIPLKLLLFKNGIVNQSGEAVSDERDLYEIFLNYYVFSDKSLTTQLYPIDDIDRFLLSPAFYEGETFGSVLNRLIGSRTQTDPTDVALAEQQRLVEAREQEINAHVSDVAVLETPADSWAGRLKAKLATFASAEATAKEAVEEAARQKAIQDEAAKQERSRLRLEQERQEAAKRETESKEREDARLASRTPEQILADERAAKEAAEGWEPVKGKKGTREKYTITIPELNLIENTESEVMFNNVFGVNMTGGMANQTQTKPDYKNLYLKYKNKYTQLKKDLGI